MNDTVAYNNTTPKDIKVSVPASYPIPEQLRFPEYRFIKVNPRSKIPAEKGWHKTKNYIWNDPELIRWITTGGNYGILPRGGLTIIDIDSIPDAVEIGMLEAFKDTFTVKSGSGNGIHIYIKNSLYSTRISYRLKTSETEMGELYGNGASNFVVGPGSIHPSGGRYEITRNIPIMDIVDDYLYVNLIDKISLTGTKHQTTQQLETYSVGNITTEMGLRVEEFLMPNNLKHMGNGEIQGEHPIHGSKTGINLTINPSKNVWHCFRHNTGGDALLAAGIKYGIIQCEDCVNGEIPSEKYAEIKDILYANGYRPDVKLKQTPTPTPTSHVSLPCNPTLDVHLEDDNFIMKYMRTMTKRSDGYPEYWFAGALVCLSNVVQRNGFMTFSHTPELYPNVWCFILGLSSVSKKSTAIKFCQEMLDHEQIYPSRFYNSFSPEGFIDGLTTTPKTYITVDEVSGMLSSIATKTYMSDMQERFCQAYDCDEIHHKLRKEKFVIREPYVTQLVATTPNAFEENVSTKYLDSGWFHRYLWFYPNYKKARKPMQLLTTDVKNELKMLNDEILERWVFFSSKNNNKITFALSNDMFEEYTSWADASDDKVLETKSDHRISANSRLQIHALKLAMLFEVGSVGFTERADDGVVRISDEHMREAMRLIDTYFRPMADIIIRIVEGASSQNLFNKIINVMKSNGNIIDRKTLTRLTRILAKDLDQYLSTMEHDMGIIETTMSVNPDTNRQQTVYRYLGE